MPTKQRSKPFSTRSKPIMAASISWSTSPAAACTDTCSRNFHCTIGKPSSTPTSPRPFFAAAPSSVLMKKQKSGAIVNISSDIAFSGDAGPLRLRGRQSRHPRSHSLAGARARRRRRARQRRRARTHRHATRQSELHRRRMGSRRQAHSPRPRRRRRKMSPKPSLI